MISKPINEITLVGLVTFVLILQSITYADFFIFNPFAIPINPVLSWVQVLLLMAWPLMVLGYPLVFILRSKFGKPANWVLRLLAGVWPISLLLVHFVLFVISGDPALNYLINYPIFIFSDIIVPVLFWRQATRS